MHSTHGSPGMSPITLGQRTDFRNMGEKMSEGLALGRHITVELTGCDAKIIADSDAVKKALLGAAEASGAHIVESSFHYFSPQGVSGFVIISESHYSIHTWPEFDYAAVDVFTCGETISPLTGIEYLKKALHARESVISADMWRGTAFNYTEKAAKNDPSGSSLDLERLFSSSHPYGISCAIDLSGCARGSVQDMKTVFHLLSDKIKCRCGNPQFGEFENGNIAVCSAFDGNTSLMLRIDKTVRSVHIDLFSREYADPRECALLALAGFGAESYKIHPALRMN